jgi:hypothetical protein
MKLTSIKDEQFLVLTERVVTCPDDYDDRHVTQTHYLNVEPVKLCDIESVLIDLYKRNVPFKLFRVQEIQPKFSVKYDVKMT